MYYGNNFCATGKTDALWARFVVLWGYFVRVHRLNDAEDFGDSLHYGNNCCITGNMCCTMGATCRVWRSSVLLQGGNSEEQVLWTHNNIVSFKTFSR